MPGHVILIVDDDLDLRETLVLVLEDAGYRTQLAANGREALEVLRAGPPPDVILLDLMMPVMDGWQFRAAQLADPALAPIPVVLFSASGNIREKAAELGLADYLEKPIDLHSLLAMLEHILGGNGTRPGA